jgi:hypothetical protein
MLLQLPREIRDLIYEHMLVRDAIAIDGAITKPTSSSVPDNFEELRSCYPLRAPRVHRRLWPMPAFDMNLEAPNSYKNRSFTVYMTYQFDKQKPSTFETGPNLNMLQTNKQIYTEASKTFYGSNVFSFTGDFRIPTAFAFLCDRPATSLRLIQYLELALMEDSNMRGTPQAHYPTMRRSTDSLVLQYAYHYFTELCTLLSTPRIRLRKLYLIVETMSVPSRPTPSSLYECLAWEKYALAASETRVPPLWLDPLLKIGNLQSMELCWIARHPRLSRMACTVGEMRRHMLASTQDEGLPTQSMTQSDMDTTSFRFSVLQKVEEGQSLVADSLWPWEEAVLEGDDDVRCIAPNDDEVIKALPSLRTRRHLETALELYVKAYVCFCVIDCA